MRKFKLIKEYPGSLKLNSEVIYSEKHQIYNYNGGNYFSELPKHQVENLPEFWQEIKEKKYEILSLIESLKDSTICSIKRLSDGQIFTVGEEVEQGIIKSIEITPDDLLVRTAKRWNYLELIKKKPVEQVLFTTQDGAKITDKYKGNLYLVDKISFELKIGMIISMNDMLRTYSDSHFMFFSYEKAKDFITRNKPCLSLREISQIYITANKYDPKNPNVQGQAEQIYKLVQTKLKL